MATVLMAQSDWSDIIIVVYRNHKELDGVKSHDQLPKKYFRPTCDHLSSCELFDGGIMVAHYQVMNKVHRPIYQSRLLDNCNYKNYKSISWLQIDLEKSRAWIYLVCCPKSPSKRLMGSWLYTISTIQKDVKSVCLQACELLLPQSMGLVSPKLDVHNRQLPKSIPKVLVLGCSPWSI